jgi:hypothetical protein
MTPLAVRKSVFSGATTGRTRIPTIAGRFVDSAMEEDREGIVDGWGSQEGVVKTSVSIFAFIRDGKCLERLDFFSTAA